jgi:hypothetical protein
MQRKIKSIFLFIIFVSSSNIFCGRFITVKLGFLLRVLNCLCPCCKKNKKDNNKVKHQSSLKRHNTDSFVFAKESIEVSLKTSVRIIKSDGELYKIQEQPLSCSLGLKRVPEGVFEKGEVFTSFEDKKDLIVEKEQVFEIRFKEEIEIMNS